MSCLPQTRPTVFLLDKDYKSNKCSANAVFNFHLKATPYLWTVVYSDLKLSPFQYNWRAKRANLVVLCARFLSLSLSLYLSLYIYIYIFPGQCHTVISNLAITRIILNPFYNAAVYTAYSEPTMHCIYLVYATHL